ncbi:MbtH family protein [Kribbella endophytica]
MTTSSGQRTVVRNEEEQYSLWPAGRGLPPGWTEVGVSGSEEDCLEYIERTWTDLRPLSLRQALAASEQP